MNEIVLQDMTAEESIAWKNRVGGTATELRLLLNEGYERAAWVALGYKDWTDCLHSMAQEFGQSERHFWRLHAANEIEKLLTHGSVGVIPERQTRPLTTLAPEAQRTAWQTAVDTAPNGKVTAAHVQSVVDTMTGKVAPVVEVMTPAMDLETAEQIVKEARQIRRDEIRQERTERINEIARGNQPLHAVQRYPVILADPPWRYEHSKTTSREIENHYPTMSLDEICDLPVGELATPDAILFLWTTSPKLAESMKVIEAWGFEYRTCMVWVKDKIGMGYYARQRHELLLIAKRGEIPVPEPSNRFDSVIEWPRTEHSAKPPIVHERIEEMYAEFDKVELFARSPRVGWAVWGNQSNE